MACSSRIASAATCLFGPPCGTSTMMPLVASGRRAGADPATTAGEEDFDGARTLLQGNRMAFAVVGGIVFLRDSLRVTAGQRDGETDDRQCAQRHGAAAFGCR